MGRFVISVLVYAALVVYLTNTLFTHPELASGSLLGQPTPTFELPRLKDPDSTLGNVDVSKQVSLLNVWASWCPACRQEHPYLVELARSGAIPIYGLNYVDDRDNAIKLLSEMGDPYVASGFDETGDVAHRLGVHGAPETFLIDTHGTILHRHLSPLTPDVWEREFVPRIKDAH